jgi:hypothetical protein
MNVGSAQLTIYSVQRCTDRFKEVIALYTEKTNDRALKKFDILGCHTWEEVQDTAAKAVEAYNAKEKGFKGFLRKVGRKFGKASPAHQGWIQTLYVCHASSIDFLLIISKTSRRLQRCRMWGTHPYFWGCRKDERG